MAHRSIVARLSDAPDLLVIAVWTARSDALVIVTTIIELAEYYRFAGIDLTQLLWNPRRGTTAFDRDGTVVFKYSRPSQLEIATV